jgi:uncharacterized caspase-like protein
MKLSFTAALAALGLAAALAIPAWGADCALVVGIDEYQDDGPPKCVSPDLFACVSDAKSMAQLFKEMGLADNNVRLLADGAAQKQAIVDGLKWLAATAGPGDSAYFYYSGHGSTGLTDTDGDEPDGGDEGLVPADVVTPNDYYEEYINDPQVKARVDATQLYDDELDDLLSAIAARAGHVVVILDSCHSAGATKGLAGGKSWPKEYFTALGIDPQAKPYHPGRPRPPQPGAGGGPGSGPAGPGGGLLPGSGPSTAGSPAQGPSTLQSGGIGDSLFYEGQSALPNLIVLAGCEPTQFSQADPELGHGSFSFALLDAVYNNPRQADLDADGRLSWLELGRYAHFWVSQRSQQEAAQAGDDSMLQFPVVYNEAAAQALFIDAPTVGSGRELLEPVQLPQELLGS